MSHKQSAAQHIDGPLLILALELEKKKKKRLQLGLLI